MRKNLMSRLRSGILVAAAASMVIANVAAYAAEDDVEEPAGIFWEENVISGTVTEVDASSITVKASGMMEGAGFAMGMPEGGRPEGMPDGQTPPEPPEGETPPELPDGQTPPELPDGQTPPELPEGTDALMGGQRPEGMPQGERPEGMPEGERPEGMPEGERPEGMPGGQLEMDIVVNISSDTAIIKGSDENADISDITVGSTVMVMLDGDTALSILVLD